MEIKKDKNEGKSFSQRGQVILHQILLKEGNGKEICFAMLLETKNVLTVLGLQKLLKVYTGRCSETI